MAFVATYEDKNGKTVSMNESYCEYEVTMNEREFSEKDGES